LPVSIGPRDSARLEDKQCRKEGVETTSATSIALLFPVIFITGNRMRCVFVEDSLVSVGRSAKN